MIINNFFFSSRRRHTRLVSDWSSDVCSSDLPGSGGDRTVRAGPPPHPSRVARDRRDRSGHRRRDRAPWRPGGRSEERRVGKESRYRWSSYDENKKYYTVYVDEDI